jgi:hypothetical protein
VSGLEEIWVPLVDEPIGSIVEQLRKDPRHREAVAQEVRAVAAEVAADPAYAEDEALGPDDGARERFRQFARKQLG